MVARLTPDQKVACSIHVGFKIPIHNGSVFSLLFYPLGRLQEFPDEPLGLVSKGQELLHVTAGVYLQTATPKH